MPSSRWGIGRFIICRRVSARFLHGFCTACFPLHKKKRSYLSRVGLLRYNCHSGYLSSVVQENEMSNVLTPAGGIFRRFVEPGQEVEYGQKLGVILDPFTAEVGKNR